MKIHGSLQTNLEGAISSAKRHRGRPVYPQTLAYWSALSALAWNEIRVSSGPRGATLTRLVTELDKELAARPELPTA